MGTAHVLLAAALLSGVDVEVGSLAGDPKIVKVGTPAKGRILGDVIRGELTQLTDSRLTIRVDGQPQQFDLDEVLMIERQTPVAGAGDELLAVQLTDGTRLKVSQVTVDARQANLNSPSFGDLQIDRGRVRSIRFESVLGLESEWADLLRRKSRYDMLVVRKEKTIKNGDEEQVVRTLDHLAGIVAGVDEATVAFQLDGNSISVKRENVFGVIYSSQPAEPAGAADIRCHIETAAGERIGAERVSSDGEYLFVSLESGQRLEFPLDQVVRIDFSAQRITYLSDLKPEFEYTPFFNTTWNFQRDQNLYGQPLGCERTIFDRGLCVHSKSVLTYDLDENYKRFQSAVGIEREVQPNGDVQLQILADGRKLFEARVVGTDAIRLVDLDVTGVSRLQIVVDYGEGLDLSDHVCFGEARLIK